MNRTECREGLRGVADRLTSECAGGVPPGRVIALVFRVHHALALGPTVDPEERLAACEESARRLLANRPTTSRRPPATTRRRSSAA